MKGRLFILSVLTAGLALLLTLAVVAIQGSEAEIVLELSPNVAFASRPDEFTHTVQNSISLGYISEMTFVTQTWSSENGSYKLAKQEDILITPVDNDDSIVTINVDPSITYQTFEGFGESFDGSTIHNLSRMPPEKKTEVLRLLIDPVHGAGFNLFRICIGTSDFSPKIWGWYSLDDPPFTIYLPIVARNYYAYVNQTWSSENGYYISAKQEDIPTDFSPKIWGWYSSDDCPNPDPDLRYFSIQKDKDNEIISILKEALEIAKYKVDLRFIASPWSPPAWMKTSCSMCGGELDVKYNDVYAKYLFEFLDAYKKEGIPIYAITVQNEPGWVATTPTTCMTPTQEADIITTLMYSITENQEIDTKILAHDWNFDDTPQPPRDCFPNEYTHIQLTRDVLTSLDSPGDYVYGVAFHSYDWVGNDEHQVVQLLKDYPDLKMYHTEMALFNTDGMDYIVRMLRHGMSTYIGWVTMLDDDPTTPDHQYPGTPQDPYFILDFDHPENYSITPTFYLKQQFSKFIQFGAKRIYSDAGTCLSNVAFLNPDNTIVMIVVNQCECSKEFRVKINSNPQTQFITTIPGKLVATYEWNCKDYIPSPTTNLALDKSVEASSNDPGAGDVSYVTDGDARTRWGSDWNDDEWILVDLGSSTNIQRIVLDWEDAFGEEYKILIFDDESEWTEIVHEKYGYKDMHAYYVNVTGRYVKVQGIKRGTGWGYSLYEFEVY